MKTLEDIEVRHFKLINGESVVGFVQHVDETHIHITDPYTIEVYDESFHTTPFFPLSSKKNMFKINLSHIIESSIVDDQIKEYFITHILEEEKNKTKYTKEREDRYSDWFDDDIEDNSGFNVKLSNKIVH